MLVSRNIVQSVKVVKNTITAFTENSTTFFPSNQLFFKKGTKELISRKLLIVVHTVEITEFYCHDFSQKFRQINVLLKNFTKIGLTQKNLCGSEFLVFPHSVAKSRLWQNDSFLRSKICKIDFT